MRATLNNPGIMASLSRNQYTIVWVCALAPERSAAVAMLDLEHAQARDFVRPLSDTNLYAYGSIDSTHGTHNVIIASPPDDKDGPVSAASIVPMMLMAFPKIRFGLMVGTGAGIPRLPSRDIRLGDVVVSQPHGAGGGLIQYDFDKPARGGTLHRDGSLSSPPAALLRALGIIRTHHDQCPPRIPEFLQQMVTRYPLMGARQQNHPEYIHPGSQHDLLFKETYPHVPGRGCSACNKAQLQNRTTRTDTVPWVHYGAIASGGTPVKDIAVAARLLRQTAEDCICLETEAAGLMDTFPCLVIRGICDYADSHNNGQWRNYAAAVAAAYAKELLHHVFPRDVEETPLVVDTVQAGGQSPERSLGSLAQHTTANLGSASVARGDPDRATHRQLPLQVENREPADGGFVTINQKPTPPLDLAHSPGPGYKDRIGFFLKSEVNAALRQDPKGFLSAARSVCGRNGQAPWGWYGSTLFTFMQRFALTVPFSVRHDASNVFVWEGMDHGSWIRLRSNSSDPFFIMSSITGELLGWCNNACGESQTYRSLYLGLLSWSMMELAKYLDIF